MRQDGSKERLKKKHSSIDEFNREIVITHFIPGVHILPPQTLVYEFESLVGYLNP